MINTFELHLAQVKKTPNKIVDIITSLNEFKKNNNEALYYGEIKELLVSSILEDIKVLSLFKNSEDFPGSIFFNNGDKRYTQEFLIDLFEKCMEVKGNGSVFENLSDNWQEFILTGVGVFKKIMMIILTYAKIRLIQ